MSKIGQANLLRKYSYRRANGLCLTCGAEALPKKSKCSRCRWERGFYNLRFVGLPESEITKARAAVAVFDGVCQACGRCGACGVWCLDHDHINLTFRGIIGHRCNVAIGMASESPEILRRLVSYVQR